MTTSRREVLIGTAAASVTGAAQSAATPRFVIELSPRYLETMQALAQLRRANDFAEEEQPYRKLKALQAEMRTRVPTSAGDLLELATRVLTTHACWSDGSDPCGALAEAMKWTTEWEVAGLDLAWAVFALAGNRVAPPAAWPAWEPLLREDPDL